MGQFSRDSRTFLTGRLAGNINERRGRGGETRVWVHLKTEKLWKRKEKALNGEEKGEWNGEEKVYNLNRANMFLHYVTF